MEKFQKIKIASILGILGNLFLFVIKASVGFMTNSQAMIVDAFNSFSDIISSVMTFVGNRIASKPRDEDHDLGHGKAEYIYSMIISIIIFALSLKLFYDSTLSLVSKPNYTYSNWLIIICLIAIAIKYALYLYTNKIAKNYDNLLIKANSIDHRNDCFITLFNMIAAILSANGIVFVDGLVGISISVWIFFSGLEIFKTSYDVLMDKSISLSTKEEVLKIISAHDEVLGINHFNSTPIGYQYQISFTIFVDGNLSTFASHAIADSLEDEIGEKMPEIYLTIVHVNPIKIKKKTKPSNRKTKSDK